MNSFNEFGLITHVAATGTLTIGAGNNIQLLGIGLGSTASPAIAIQTGTASFSTPVTLLTALTCASNTFTRIPAYCPGGATFTFTGVVPDLVIYWNPVSGIAG